MSISTGRPWRVLVIDDDEAVMGSTRSLLLRAGFDVCSETSAGRGLDAARSFRPDLILLDLRMPEMDGPEAIAILRADPALSTIVTAAYSGFIPLFGEERLLKLGFNALLSKPLSYAELVAGVRRILFASDSAAA